MTSKDELFLWKVVQLPTSCQVPGCFFLTLETWCLPLDTQLAFSDSVNNTKQACWEHNTA